MNANPTYSCHLEVWDGLLFSINLFGAFVQLQALVILQRGEKEGEKALPSFLGRTEEIPVEKANTLLLSECSITQCLGQISLMMFSFVENCIQHTSCFLNRVSDEPDSGVKAVECESHILMASRTEADIGCFCSY